MVGGIGKHERSDIIKGIGIRTLNGPSGLSGIGTLRGSVKSLDAVSSEMVHGKSKKFCFDLRKPLASENQIKEPSIVVVATGRRGSCSNGAKHWPWSLTGVTAPFFLPSILEGTAVAFSYLKGVACKGFAGSSNGAKQQSNRHSLRSEKHSSSFGRNHHYRDCDAYRSNGERSVQGGYRDHYSYRDPYPTAFEVSNYFTGRNDAYKRSQSMVVSGKNAEERQVSPDISRVPSPRLSSPNSASSMIGLDGLASSMAEVCALTGSNNTRHSSVQRTLLSSPICCMPLASINNCATPAQTSMVAPFTGLKSTSAFPVTRKVNDITFISSNGGKVSCTERNINTTQLKWEFNLLGRPMDVCDFNRRDWINGSERRVAPGFVKGGDSVVWSRKFSDQVCDRSTLQHVLETIRGAKRMIMGHTIQETGINGVCDNKAIRIDVGMSKGCGDGLP
ncbi:hypothetical protein IFM89_020105 [Coptis chinensis]|uniref:Ribulose-1,5-bisphosphate carboxylase small subunit N-terminal domain-containing protein n=1 Tax=Coptis chinensis TaxID=261450 RepID=A0A835LS88_9MAGN|nr:hypothetical protein IFM89_020105 [Coptis chinensis]